MGRCFVIQPFDKGRFDKRYNQIFVPAIEAAGLEAYRVDKDDSSDVPIDSIEEGIRSAVVCLADITTDNPNVWYELGYSFASGVPVVMVCAEPREGKKYPFDIQHRTVTPYTNDAPDDFKQLQETITRRLKASVLKGARIQKLAEEEQTIAPVDGLSPNEMTVLALMAGSMVDPDDTCTAWSLQQDSGKAGLTKLGCTLGLHKLLEKKFVEKTTARDDDYQREYEALRVCRTGWSWIHANEDKFLLKKTTYSRNASSNLSDPAITDDDIPF